MALITMKDLAETRDVGFTVFFTVSGMKKAKNNVVVAIAVVAKKTGVKPSFSYKINPRGGLTAREIIVSAVKYPCPSPQRCFGVTSDINTAAIVCVAPKPIPWISRTRNRKGILLT